MWSANEVKMKCKWSEYDVILIKMSKNTQKNVKRDSNEYEVNMKWIEVNIEWKWSETDKNVQKLRKNTEKMRSEATINIKWKWSEIEVKMKWNW